MIIREIKCTKCGKKTFHEEVSPNTWKCQDCGRVKISHFKLAPKSLKTVYTFLYKDNNLYYFEDVVGQYAFKKEDIEKLDEGVIRVPIYRISKHGKKL